MDENEEVKFDLSQIEKTFTEYRLNQILDGVVVGKREDGVVFNIGGKLDAFIPKSDFEDFNFIKYGDRFQVVVTNKKNEEGMVEVSKAKADNLILGTLQANKLKLGSTFSFVVIGATYNSLVSKLGEYDVYVPQDQITDKPFKTLKQFVGKRFDGLVTDIDAQNKQITASIKMLEERVKQNIELAFWNSVFVNKLVLGTISKIMPYGAFVNVNGVTCFIHISDIAHEHVSDISKYLTLGKEYTFKVIAVDKETKKVNLSYKALQVSPKQDYLNKLTIGQELTAKVVKILPFGAILKDNQTGFEGLLHISDASKVFGSFIKELVSVGEELIVLVKNIDKEKSKINFELKDKR